MENLAFEDIELSNSKEKNEKDIEIITNGHEKNGDIIEIKSYSFEEAITLTGSGKFHRLLLLTSGLCFMATMVEIMGVSLVIELAKCDMDFTIYEQGILASSGFLGVVCSSHALGFLADTVGRSKILKFALIFSIISSAASVFSTTVWMLIILRFLVGFFISGCQACVFSYMGEFHGKKTRLRNVTMLSCFLPLGLVVLPALATIILPMKLELYLGSMKFSSWRFLTLCNAIPTVLALIGVLCFPESPKYLLAQGRHDEAIEVMKKCYKMNTNMDPSTYPVEKVYLDVVGANFSNVKTVCDALKLIWSQTVPLFNRERIFHTLNIFFIMFNIFMIAQGTFMWFPVMLNAMVHYADTDFTICESVRELKKVTETMNYNVTTDIDELEMACEDNIDIYMYQVLIMMGIAYTILYLIFSWVIVYTGKRRLIIIFLTIAGAGSIALYWTNIFYVNLILITLTMAVGNCGGITNTISMEYYPTNINAMGMCLIMMIGRIGAIVGSNIIGLILNSNCEFLYMMYGALIILMIPLAFLLPNTNKT
ncbi:synaptic vesicle glycoprotein 2B-like [Condylostylus longicornis]|uniref:synaptic vesicle glycoprotein 2B-like n=1 Tax=Condylostylus longicornis TaxID=2530218 RepID=UPI00244DF39A|nr:synaptic vesicle glycoprotein 2B-like [Condylostylus longicornis]